MNGRNQPSGRSRASGEHVEQDVGDAADLGQVGDERRAQRRRAVGPDVRREQPVALDGDGRIGLVDVVGADVERLEQVGRPLVADAVRQALLAAGGVAPVDLRPGRAPPPLLVRRQREEARPSPRPSPRRPPGRRRGRRPGRTRCAGRRRPGGRRWRRGSRRHRRPNHRGRRSGRARRSSEQQLGDLHRVEGGALAQVVVADEQGQAAAVLDAGVGAQAPDVAGVARRRPGAGSGCRSARRRAPRPAARWPARPTAAGGTRR